MLRLRLSISGHLLLLLAAANLATATEDVFLQFYMDQVRLWDQQGQQVKLQSAMLAGLRDYCSVPANFVSCGINSTADVTFTAAAVVISPGYPTNANSRYLDVRIGIEYSAGSTLVRLPAVVVKDIAASRRESISSSVGYYLVYINNDFYSIPPATMANKVVVPIFVLGTLALIIVALALRHHQIGERHKRLRSSGSELKPHRKSASAAGGDRGDNKVSAADLKTNDQKQQKETASAPLSEKDAGKKKHNKNSKSKSKSKSKAGNKASVKTKPVATIDWSGGGGKKATGNGEFNNIGFDKSINEGDPRARQSGASHSGAVSEHQQQRSMINQSASNLSEIIQVRSGAASPMSKGQDRGKKQKTRKRTGDAEEDNLMDNSVFKPPEGNLTDAERLSASEDDGVPTLRDSSDQQMI